MNNRVWVGALAVVAASCVAAATSAQEHPAGAGLQPLLVAAAPESGEDAPSEAPSTQEVVSDAIGIFCVPVLIAGKLASADLIKQSGFTPGPPDPKSPGTPGFERRAHNGDRVTVSPNEKTQGCVIEVYGAASAIDDYHAVLRKQNWGAVGTPAAMPNGAHMEIWRVSFGPRVRDAGADQFVFTRSPEENDPAKPQVSAVFQPAR